MKKLLFLFFISAITIACTNVKHAEFEKNTEKAKAFFKLHETEQAEEMFTYLHEDMEWHMPVYGMGMGGIDEVKAAIIGYQAEFDNMKFTADNWLPGVDTDTGIPDGSTRVYGTWTSVNAKTGIDTSLTSYHSFEFKDGKIINGGDWFDLGGMMNTSGHKNIVVAEFKILPGKEAIVFAAMDNTEIGLNITRNYKGCNSLVSTFNKESNTLFVMSEWDSYEEYDTYLKWRNEEFTDLGEAIIPYLKGGIKGFKAIYPNSDYKIY